MKKKLTDNISLKIMSVAVAVIVWLLVVNVDNPIITDSFVVTNVEFINAAYIEDDGKMFMQEEEQDPIRVTIKGERKTLNRIRVSDIHAVADLQQAVSLNTDPVMVPVSVSCAGISSENIEVTPRNISIHIEDKVTQEFVVNVTTKGDSKPAKGYEVGTLTSSPEKIKITGPQSLINKIDNVSAYINVDGRATDITKETEVVIVDKNGETISDTVMKYMNVSDVVATAKLWKVRSDVKLKAGYIGEPADGYQVDSVVLTPDVVSVAGTEDALEVLAEQRNIIQIPDEYVDISGKSTDYEEKIDLSDLLPDGLKVINASSVDVFVKVNILPVGSMSYEIPTKDISVENTPKDMQVTFDTAMIEIRVKKAGEDLEDLDAEKIKMSIDLEGKEAGGYEVPVTINLPEGYELVDNVVTEIKMAEISEADTVTE